MTWCVFRHTVVVMLSELSNCCSHHFYLSGDIIYHKNEMQKKKRIYLLSGVNVWDMGIFG